MILKFPPTRVVRGPLKYNANARVNLMGILLRRGIARPGAVFAQEDFEWVVRAVIFSAVCAAFTAAILLTGLLLLIPVGLLVAYAAAELPWVRGPGMRWLELRGHAVTVQAAWLYYPQTLDNLAAYRLAHTRSMKSFYPAFRHMTVDEIDARLYNLRGWATRWVQKGWVRKRIAKVMAAAAQM